MTLAFPRIWDVKSILMVPKARKESSQALMGKRGLESFWLSCHQSGPRSPYRPMNTWHGPAFERSIQLKHSINIRGRMIGSQSLGKWIPMHWTQTGKLCLNYHLSLSVIQDNSLVVVVRASTKDLNSVTSDHMHPRTNLIPHTKRAQ